MKVQGILFKDATLSIIEDMNAEKKVFVDIFKIETLALNLIVKPDPRIRVKIKLLQPEYQDQEFIFNAALRVPIPRLKVSGPIPFNLLFSISAIEEIRRLDFDFKMLIGTETYQIDGIFASKQLSIKTADPEEFIKIIIKAINNN